MVQEPLEVRDEKNYAFNRNKKRKWMKGMLARI